MGHEYTPLDIPLEQLYLYFWPLGRVHNLSYYVIISIGSYNLCFCKLPNKLINYNYFINNYLQLTFCNISTFNF